MYREICGDCEHIALFSNEPGEVDLATLFQMFVNRKPQKYGRNFYKYTTRKEIQLITRRM